MHKLKLIVIGAGAAGMMAAISAAQNGIPGREILVLERNEKPGKKIYITGKGRCNLTNACEMDELFLNVPRQAKFLYSAFYTFSNEQVIDFFEHAGMKTKVERGNRVFPVSDHASDVIGALKRMMDRLDIQVEYHARVRQILTGEGAVSGVRLEDGREYHAGQVLIATGGKSYPTTGSSGDGYMLAQSLGHTITELRPSLVPFTVAEEDVIRMQGLAPKNVRVQIFEPAHPKKVLFEDFGEMLFTHFGVSGPLMLSASSVVNDEIAKDKLTLLIDWKPAITEEQLDKRILKDFEENQNKQFKNALSGLAPAKLLPVLMKRSGIPEEKKVNEITREERWELVRCLKAFSVTLTGLRDFNEAIITRGGISLKEVNPSTMESKLVPGLCFAGEVLDLDAFTGGFNLQIAWSTGYLAGLCAAENYK
ncbi:MAG: NAD(P)/FAD-dependent oxidoreductase [Eubacterium sp.]|nr:NAD(P)/FAD-dependent oxidoreductase [Eubacterium sp.]